MKTLIALLTLVALSASGQTDKPLLQERALPSVAAPSFKEPLAAPFSTIKGKWTIEEGVMKVTNLPEEKHIPVLHHTVGLASAVIECEFRFDGPGPFLIGCDGTKHVGRVVVTATALSIAEDSVAPSHTVAKLPLTVKAEEWHQLRVEWKGDQMAARLDGQELRARHEYLASPKARSWLAAGQNVKVRNLKISGEPAAAKP
ncbi:MAG: hypothetical protein EBS05_00420 [Proteobacteria bacterium]|nr:hypothetical protein [Pseudomonadota bacterium]